MLRHFTNDNIGTVNDYMCFLQLVAYKITNKTFIEIGFRKNYEGLSSCYPPQSLAGNTNFRPDIQNDLVAMLYISILPVLNFLFPHDCNFFHRNGLLK